MAVKKFIDRKDTGGDPEIYIEGFEPLIERDLQKHKDILERTKLELNAYRQAVSHEVKKKKHYASLIGSGKFNDDALRESIKTQINTNIRHMSDKAKLAQDKIEHETLIVDTLTKQLEEYRGKMQKLAEYRMKQAIQDAINSRLGESAN